MNEQQLRDFFLKTSRKFMNQFVEAKSKSGWVMGVQIPSKNDLRRAFIADLQMIQAMANLFKNSDLVGVIDAEVKKQEALVTEEPGFLEEGGE